MMFSRSALLILAGWFALLAPLARAGLWGWPSEWTVSVWDPDFRACPGFGNWCPGSDRWNECVKMEEFRSDHPDRHAWFWQNKNADKFSWAHMRKKDSAWIDVWKADDGRYYMYESNGNGQRQGECRRYDFWETCKGNKNKFGIVAMHCWQW